MDDRAHELINRLIEEVLIPNVREFGKAMAEPGAGIGREEVRPQSQNISKEEMDLALASIKENVLKNQCIFCHNNGSSKDRLPSEMLGVKAHRECFEEETKRFLGGVIAARKSGQPTWVEIFLCDDQVCLFAPPEDRQARIRKMIDFRCTYNLNKDETSKFHDIIDEVEIAAEERKRMQDAAQDYVLHTDVLQNELQRLLRDMQAPADPSISILHRLIDMIDTLFHEKCELIEEKMNILAEFETLMAEYQTLQDKHQSLEVKHQLMEFRNFRNELDIHTSGGVAFPGVSAEATATMKSESPQSSPNTGIPDVVQQPSSRGSTPDETGHSVIKQTSEDTGRSGDSILPTPGVVQRLPPLTATPVKSTVQKMKDQQGERSHARQDVGDGTPPFVSPVAEDTSRSTSIVDRPGILDRIEKMKRDELNPACPHCKSKDLDAEGVCLVCATDVRNHVMIDGRGHYNTTPDPTPCTICKVDSAEREMVWFRKDEWDRVLDCRRGTFKPPAESCEACTFLPSCRKVLTHTKLTADELLDQKKTYEDYNPPVPKKEG